jgi:hypothetical protein
MISKAYVFIGLLQSSFGEFLGNKHSRTEALKCEFRSAAALTKIRPVTQHLVPSFAHFHHMQTVEKFLLATLKTPSGEPICERTAFSTRANWCQRPSSTMRIFSSAAWCFRVARRMLRTSVSDDAGLELDFCLIFAP